MNPVLPFYFDALIKFKSVTVPNCISCTFRMYCLARGVKTFIGLMHKGELGYRIIYVK